MRKNIPSVKNLAGDLGPSERRLVIGVCVISAAALVSGATFNYAINPMVDAFEASETQTSLLRQLPNIGALLVIFIAGVVGPRWGARRFLVACGALMAIGYTLVTVAPAMAVASTGLLIGSIGRQGLFIVVIGLLSMKLTTDEARATGFSAFAAVSPAVYLIAPAVAGALATQVSWRAIALLWVLSALGAIRATRRLLPPDEPSLDQGELWTPALAGFVLASLVQAINIGSADGFGSPHAVTWLVLTMAGAVALFILMRRITNPTLDVSILRNGGIRLLLLVVILVPFTNLWYYSTLGLQYVYGMTAFQAAVVMMPSQLAGLAGATVASRFIKRRGIRVAGTASLLVAALSMFLCLPQTVSTPVWAPMLVLCVYSAAITAAGIPLTNSIMNLAPPGEEGSASAFRGAASSLGAAIGVVLMTTVVFGTYQSSLTSAAGAAGADNGQAASVTQHLREAVVSEEASAKYTPPLPTVDTINDDQRQAMVEGYRSQGLVGGVILVIAAGVFFFNRRGLRSPHPAHWHARA